MPASMDFPLDLKKKSRDGKVTAPGSMLGSEFAPLPYAGFTRIRFEGFRLACLSSCELPQLAQ
jgi:hypothetical protein